MLVIESRNINGAWDTAKMIMNQVHVVRPSRVGEVWEYPTPVTTLYRRPCERVLFNEARNPNPFFHFFEGLWMLAGRNDVGWISRYNKRMAEYSDDGKILHGAYGYRWQEWFEMLGGGEEGSADQLPKIVRMLRNDPNERRAVLQMWDPVYDLENPTCKDVPCNTNIYYKIRDGRLTQTVCNRSNDIAFGCYGSNGVHMSMLQEYLAAMIGVPVGPYYQVSDSWHAYTERWKQLGGLDTLPSHNHYDGTYDPVVEPYAMVQDADTWNDELLFFMAEEIPPHGYTNTFFSHVAIPLQRAWTAYQSGDLVLAQREITACRATDWAFAGKMWLEGIEYRRAARKAEV